MAAPAGERAPRGGFRQLSVWFVPHEAFRAWTPALHERCLPGTVREGHLRIFNTFWNRCALKRTREQVSRCGAIAPWAVFP